MMETQSGKTRIAVADADYIGQAHLNVAQHSATCTLAAIVDPAPAASEIAARAVVPLYRTLDELIAKDRPDGIVLATPNQLHIEQARFCLDARIPMLLEKPIAPTVTEARALADAVEASGVPMLIGHHRAHSPIMARAKQVIDESRLGKLVVVMDSAVFFKPDHYYADAPWHREPDGGPILLNMIHEVHNLRMLCGDIFAVQAFASHATRGFAFEDTVAINLRFASGALGTFMLSDTVACARNWEQTSQEKRRIRVTPTKTVT